MLAARLRAAGVRRVGVVGLERGLGSAGARACSPDALAGSPTRVVAAATYPRALERRGRGRQVLAPHVGALVVVGTDESAAVVRAVLAATSAARRPPPVPSPTPAPAAGAGEQERITGCFSRQPRACSYWTPRWGPPCTAALPRGALAGAVGVAPGPGESRPSGGSWPPRPTA